MDNLTTFLLIISILSALLSIFLWCTSSRCESKEKSIKYREDRDYWAEQYRETNQEFKLQQSVFQSFLPLIHQTGKPFCAADIMPGKFLQCQYGYSRHPD